MSDADETKPIHWARVYGGGMSHAWEVLGPFEDCGNTYCGLEMVRTTEVADYMHEPCRECTAILKSKGLPHDPPSPFVPIE